jgi:hypothetical protein
MRNSSPSSNSNEPGVFAFLLRSLPRSRTARCASYTRTGSGGTSTKGQLSFTLVSDSKKKHQRHARMKNRNLFTAKMFLAEFFTAKNKVHHALGKICEEPTSLTKQ